MRGLVLGVIVCGAGAPARADDPASDYARESTTITLSTELSPLPSVPARGELGGAVRLHRRNVAVEARAGIAFAGSAIAVGWLVGGHFGLAAGASLPVSARFAFTPMVAYDAYVFVDSGSNPFVVQRTTVALPLTFVVYPHVVVEGVVEVGIVFIDGARELALVAGPRIGLVL